MPTFSYIPQPLNDPDGESLEVSRGIIQQLAGKLGLRIDRDFVEEPGDAYVDWQNGKFRFARLEDRPIGRQVLITLAALEALSAVLLARDGT